MKIILLIVVFFCYSIISLAQPGELDPSFGTNGIVVSSLGVSVCSAIQSSGKILLAGPIGIASYNTDGSIDNTFGNNEIQASQFSIGSITVQSNDKFVVSGSTSTHDFAVARYNSNGSPDNTFSSDGKQITDFANISYGNHSQKENFSTQWIQLFNGKDVSDWNVKITGYPLNHNYGNTFRVEDGILKVSYDAYKNFDGKFGHIFYKQKYSYYLLGVEYRFTGEQCKGGPEWAYRNSGAMLHSQSPESMMKNQDFPISIEVQLLGGNGKDERPTANLCTPGTNVVMNGKLFTNHCVSSKSKTYHGDQWIRVEVLVLGDSLIKHIIDKEIVLQYEKPQIGNGNVSNYDSAVKKDGMLLQEGYIALQSESHPVEFRKVELLNLENYAHDHEKLAHVLEQLNIR